MVSILSHNDPKVYDLTCGSMGRAVIFNQVNFDRNPTAVRRCSDINAMELASAFEALEFSVDYYQDLTRAQIFEDLAQR